ncbi:MULTISPECIES: hypothetical protein [Micromonospora]|uniref:hypothetical protein n=1 Tax=Micromonospora TaxID=1873 RepID=UPI00340D4D6A
MTRSNHDDTSRNSASGLRPAPLSGDRDTAHQTFGREPEPLLSVRTTMVLLLAAVAGIATGVLAGLAGQPLPAAALVGGGAAGGAVALFHSLIARR